MKPTTMPRAAMETGAPASRVRPTPMPADGPDGQVEALAQLLRVEADARKAGNVRELAYLMVNETRGLARARQIFLLSRTAAGRPLQVTAVSSLAVVDRQVPLMQWIERLAARVAREAGGAEISAFAITERTDAGDELAKVYPFGQMMWVPLWSRDGKVREGLVLAREIEWRDADRTIASRLALTFGHALALMRSSAGPADRLRSSRRPLAWLAATAIAFAGMIPFPISALAPLEVAPRDATMVAMPVDGIVDKVLVAPNEKVMAGQPLVRLVDTVARNKLEIAAREVTVAEARLEKAHSLAFTDARGRHELGIGRAELELRRAERDHAREMLAKTTIAAAADGIAVFGDRKDLEGKPMGTGDRLMQIARADRMELKIELAVADSIVLEPGAKVRAFLDSDPLHARLGEVSHIDYQARLSDAQVAIYRVTAQFKDEGATAAKLGTRGTALIEGPTATLGLYLFRRPLSALRQRLGL